MDWVWLLILAVAVIPPRYDLAIMLREYLERKRNEKAHPND